MSKKDVSNSETKKYKENSLSETSTGPRFITHLETEVRMHPKTLNPNLLSNIKNKLINRYKGINFGVYGFIEDIYSVDPNLGDGKMRSDDITASVYYDVKFKAKIYKPIVGSNLIAKIDSLSRETLNIIDGPAVFIVEEEAINRERFKYRGGLFHINKDGEESKIPLQVGDYVILKVIDVLIAPNEVNILSLAYLFDIPTKEEIKQYVIAENDSSLDETPLEEIIALQPKSKNVSDIDIDSDSDISSLSGSDLASDSDNSNNSDDSDDYDNSDNVKKNKSTNKSTNKSKNEYNSVPLNVDSSSVSLSGSESDSESESDKKHNKKSDIGSDLSDLDDDGDDV